MKTPVRFCGVIMFLVLVLLLGVPLTQAQGNQASSTQPQIASPANFPWSIQYIQQDLGLPLDVGRFVSIALRPFDDFPVISYYDATNSALMVAIPVPGHTGNCGTHNNWFCELVEGSGIYNVGMFSSVDIWGYSVDNWKIGISYYAATFRALNAAIWNCSVGSCIKNIVTVRAPDELVVSVGLYSSLKFDSAGEAAIAFFSYNSEHNSSTFTYGYQVPGEGNCGEEGAFGFWKCDDISYLSGEAKYASLDFSYADIAYIAYYHPSDGNLQVAYRISSFTCDDSNWTCRYIDGVDADVGYFASMVAPQSADGHFRVAYNDKTNGHLKYYIDASDPIVLDEMGSDLSPKGISMILDQNGYPVIAYQYIASEFSPPALRIARPNLVYGDEPHGNCGPPPFQSWRCTTLDAGGQYSSEAGYASVVINSRGLAAIAYSEYDVYYDASSVKFIYQTLFRTFLPMTTR